MAIATQTIPSITFGASSESVEASMARLTPLPAILVTDRPGQDKVMRSTIATTDGPPRAGSGERGQGGKIGDREPLSSDWAIFSHVAHLLSSAFDLDEVLTRLMTQVEHLLNIERGLLFLTDPATGELDLRMAVGATVGRSADSAAAKVARAGRPLQLTRVNRETGNVLGVPVVLGQTVIGVLEVRNKRESNFTNQDVTMLTTFASCIALAIEKVRLRQSVLTERERTLAAEEQARKKLARDLHDGPIQIVSGIAMRLDFCQNALKREPTLLPEEIAFIQEQAERAVHQMRTHLFELRPLILKTEGLVAALRVFLERRQVDSQTTKLTLQIESDHPNGRFSPQDSQVETILFAIVKEAVNNALKHAQAEEIKVILRETHRGIYIIIVDNGKGFNVDKVFNSWQQEGHLGLVNIRERAELIGGELRLESTLGVGTQIAISVPKT